MHVIRQYKINLKRKLHKHHPTYLAQTSNHTSVFSPIKSKEIKIIKNSMSFLADFLSITNDYKMKYFPQGNQV